MIAHKKWHFLALGRQSEWQKEESWRERRNQQRSFLSHPSCCSSFGYIGICFNQRFSSQVEQERGVERVEGKVGWYAANPDMSAVMCHIKSLKVLLQRQRQTMPDSCPERVQLPFSPPLFPPATCSRVYCQMVIILLIDFATAPVWRWLINMSGAVT